MPRGNEFFAQIPYSARLHDLLMIYPCVLFAVPTREPSRLEINCTTLRDLTFTLAAAQHFLLERAAT